MPIETHETKQRLLAVTADLLWSGSFHSSGVGEICRQAGVKKGSFYHFFPSKVDLAIESVRAAWREAERTVFDPVFAADHEGLGRVLALVSAVDAQQRAEYEARGVYLGCPFGGLGQEMAHQDPRLQATVHEIFEEHVQWFRRALQEAVETGDAEPGDVHQRARNILALMEGGLLVAKVGNDPDLFTAVVGAVPALARADSGRDDAAD